MKAVWAILQQNYQNAFRKVDIQDPGGVWKANLDDLTTREMTTGLLVLQRYDDRYMPNAPTCRKIIKGAVGRPEHQEAKLLPDVDEITQQFVRLRSEIWMTYVKRTILARRLGISADQSRQCYKAAENVCKPYEQAWRSEENRSLEIWMNVGVIVANALLESWNEIISAPEDRAVKTYGELYATGD